MRLFEWHDCGHIKFAKSDEGNGPFMEFNQYTEFEAPDK